MEPLTFDLAVFTNLSPEHLDYHGSMEAYFAAKETLFRQARVGILNGDDAYARRLPLRGLPVGVWYVCRVYGRTADSAPEVLPGHRRLHPGAGRNASAPGRQTVRQAIRAVWISDSPRPTYVCACPAPCPASSRSPMHRLPRRRHWRWGIAPRQIREALDGFPGVPGRLERVPTGGAPFSVFIDYAHTPDALERLLLTFHGCAASRAVRGSVRGASSCCSGAAATVTAASAG